MCYCLNVNHIKNEEKYQITKERSLLVHSGTEKGLLDEKCLFWWSCHRWDMTFEHISYEIDLQIMLQKANRLFDKKNGVCCVKKVLIGYQFQDKSTITQLLLFRDH